MNRSLISVAIIIYVVGILSFTLSEGKYVFSSTVFKYNLEIFILDYFHFLLIYYINPLQFRGKYWTVNYTSFI